MLPLRTIIYVLLRYVVKKQNHSLELDISGRLHEREVGLTRIREKWWVWTASAKTLRWGCGRLV